MEFWRLVKIFARLLSFSAFVYRTLLLGRSAGRALITGIQPVRDRWVRV